MEEMTHQSTPRIVYFSSELERLQQADTEKWLEEQFGKLGGQTRKLRMMTFGLIVSMVFYIVDIVSDILLAVQYAIIEDYLKCFATFAVVYFSSLVTTAVSVIWYRMILLQTGIIRMEEEETSAVFPKIPRTLHGRIITSNNYFVRSFYILILFLFQLAPLINNWICLKIILRQLRKKPVKVYFDRQIESTAQQFPGNEESTAQQLPGNEESTAQQLPGNDEIDRNEENDLLQKEIHDELLIMSMIKLHGAYEEVLITFLEDVPQSLLQTSLIFVDIVAAQGTFFTTFIAWWRLVTIILSLLKVRGATKNYIFSAQTFTFIIKDKPLQDPRKGVLSLMRATWHFLIPVGRASSLCYIATRFSYATCIYCIIFYWLMMIIWLRNDFRGRQRLENIILFIARTWIFIWVAYSCKQPRSGKFYCMYYLVLLVDVTSVFVISCVYSTRDNQHQALTTIASVGLTCQFIGVILKLIYYFCLKHKK